MPSSDRASYAKRAHGVVRRRPEGQNRSRPPHAAGHVDYPAFQITERYVVRDLSEVLNTLNDGTENPFVWAMGLLGTPAWSVRPDEEPVHVAAAWKGGPIDVARW